MTKTREDEETDSGPGDSCFLCPKRTLSLSRRSGEELSIKCVNHGAFAAGGSRNER